MRVLDLFSGLGGFSQPFKDRGHEVVTLDIEARFEPDIQGDIREVRFPGLPPIDRSFDVVLASPPCNEFSLPGLLKGFPRKNTVYGMALVAAAFEIIAEIQPKWWILENPRAMLRTLIRRPRQSVYLCNFGSDFQKATDLWGEWPNGSLPNPWPCAPHEKAPRDLNTPQKDRRGALGVQDPAERAKLPYGLGKELCKRIEDV